MSKIVKRFDTSPNLYEVVSENEKYMDLRCVFFGEKEDLGDAIFCTYENQHISIAQYFGSHFKIVTL